MSISILKVVAKAESDLIVTKHRTCQIADLAGLSPLNRAKLVAAVSECLRNAIKYTGEGRVEFKVQDRNQQQYIEVVIRDNGPGFNPEKALKTDEVSGISVCRKILDDFQIESTESTVTTVRLFKAIEKSGPRITSQMVQSWILELKRNSPFSVVEDLEQQNKLLIDTLAEVETYRNKLEERTEQLNQANKYKAEFLANMSHEIRTPMNAVIGLSNILDKTELTEEQKKYLRLIKDAGASLLEIINDILDFSKIEAGKLSIETIEIELYDIVETCVELLSTNAHSKGLSLLAWIDTSIPKRVMGDSVRLRQILVNLVNNAIKFTPAGGEVIVKLALQEALGSELLIRFEVVDSGIGLSEEQRDKLFKPFVQADGSTTRKFGGTGLGLSICRQLVELMKGQIGVESVVGAGSTFWFEIPFLVPAHESQQEKVELPFKRALVVDDHLASRELVSFLLNAWNLENETAAGANEALERLKEKQYDLFIIDYLMPELDGLELASRIKSMSAHRQSQIVLMTALHDANLGESAIASGCDAFLTKPLRQDLLLECLKLLKEDTPGQLKQSKFFHLKRSAENKALSEPAASATTQGAAGSKTAATGTVAAAAGDSNTAAAASSTGTGAGTGAGAGTGESVDSTRQVRVLLVEDNPTNQIIAQIELRNLGLDVVVASNGEEAIAAINKSHDISLIFMDCQMPVMDGYECTRRIRRMECKKGRNIPIIAMTANAMEGDREKCLEAGMDEYISKPFEPETLQGLVQTCLNLPSDRIDTQKEESAREPDNHPASIAPALDYDKCCAKFNEAQAKQILTVFLADTEKKISDLSSLIARKDCDALGKLAHSIKGAAAMIFAEGLASVSKELECAGKAGDAERLDSLGNILEEEFERFKLAARELI